MAKKKAESERSPSDDRRVFDIMIVDEGKEGETVATVHVPRNRIVEHLTHHLGESFVKCDRCQEYFDDDDMKFHEDLTSSSFEHGYFCPPCSKVVLCKDGVHLKNTRSGMACGIEGGVIECSSDINRVTCPRCIAIHERFMRG